MLAYKFLSFIFITSNLQLLWICSNLALNLPLTNKENLRHLRLIEGSMDTSVDPCDDFYNYACGNWPHYRQFNEEYFDTVTLLEYNYDKEVNNILLNEHPEGKRLRTYNQSFVDKAFIYYQSCKSTETEAFEGYFWEIKPGLAMEWPLLDELRAYKKGEGRNFLLKPESVRQFDVFSLLGQLHGYGLNDILIHLTLPSTLNAYGVFGLQAPKCRGVSHKILENFFKFSQIPSALKSKYRQELQATDRELQTMYSRFLIEPKVETMSYGELKHTYPYLARLFEMLIPHDKIDDEMLVASNLEYIQFLHDKTWQPEQIRRLCNYFMLKIFEHLKTNGIKNCGEALRKRMPLAVDFLYQQHMLLAEAKKFNHTISTLKQQLYNHFTETIRKNHFKFNIQQFEMIEVNLQRLKISMGNLPENISYAKLEDFYHRLPDLDINNFYKNDLLLRKQSVINSINCPSDISCSPYIGVIPVYVEKDDMIVVPLATLREPMFQVQYDPIFSISLLGTFVVKAFADGLDLKTIKLYNQTRSKRQECCLKESSEETSKCLESDVLGAQISYATYRSEYNIQPNFTDIPWQQLFFLNVAQFFCGRPDGIHFVDHGRQEMRLLDIAINMPEFAAAFQCQEGSRLNPRRRKC